MQTLAIFDYDGCLVHTLDAWLHADRQAMKDRGLFPTDEEIVDNIFKHDHGPATLGVDDVDQFWRDAIDLYHKNSAMISIHDGVIPTLTALRKHNVKTAILTRTELVSVNLVLERNQEFKNLFDYIVTREDISQHKPHPEGIHKIQDHFGIDSKHTFVIGDSEHDVMAGQAAGTHTILFYPPHNEAFYTIDSINALKAEYTVHDFNDIAQIIIKNQPPQS